MTGAQRRHPRAGTGSGYRPYYGYGGSRGYRPNYGYGHRPYYGYGRSYGYRPYYGYGYGYPYYGGSPYLGYGWGWGGGLSIGFGYAASDPPYAGYDPGYRDEDRPYGSDAPATERTTETGEVALDVQPDDASVYVDDQFRGTGRDARQLRLRPGRHRLEIVRPGYRTHQDEIVVEPGRQMAVDVILERS